MNRKANLKIYNSLADDLSRKTFLARLNFASCPCDDTLANLVSTLAPSFIAEVRSHIDAGRKIAVYGAGNSYWYPGRLLYSMFQSHSCGLFDKKAEEIGEVSLQNIDENDFISGRHFTTKVLPIDKIKEHLPDVAVIICVVNHQYHHQIYSDLLRLGVKQENIMFLSSLFDIVYEHDYFFASFLEYGQNETLIDCGCFDGTDAINFIKLTGGKVIAVEPGRKNFDLCRENLANYNNVELLNICVGAENGLVHFSDNGGAGDKITNEIAGGGGVEMKTIDNIAENKNITFIKMDIEGAELDALKGAEATIRRCKPKLAVCLYHKHDDIIDIPDWLVNLDLGYKLYIRHGAFNTAETILYAVPN